MLPTGAPPLEVLDELVELLLDELELLEDVALAGALVVPHI